jgi:23S rRNA (adenine2030-N6)-methyltransferase
VNYRHAYHAGNFADVLKHAALTIALEHLRQKDKGFAVIDTHAGRGLYDLSAAEALKTGEAAAGIGQLRQRTDGPAALSPYLRIASSFGEDRYPGSPLFAASLLRPQDRLVAMEKHPDECAALTMALRPFVKTRAICADGYGRLASFLPPPERRGLILIDPPYEAADEWTQVSRAATDGLKRFATGIYLLWYPFKAQGDTDRFFGEILTASPRGALRIELDLGAEAGAPPSKLRAAGLAVINPPFGFEEKMRAGAGFLAQVFASHARNPVDIRSLP